MTGEVDGVFEDETDEEIEEVTDETEDSNESDETKGDDTSEDETTGDEEEGSATPAEEEPKSVPIAALHDERRKRQLAEEEVETLRQQVPKGEEDAPDRFEDPDAYDDWLRAKWQREQDDKTRRDYVASVEESRSNMLSKHDDFVEIEQVFYVLANQDKELAQEMWDSNDPAAFAYEKGKEHLAAQRDKLRDELIAEGYTKADADDISDAEITSETKTEPKSKPKVPSLAKATAAASNSVQVEKDEDIDDMFGDQQY